MAKAGPCAADRRAEFEPIDNVLGHSFAFLDIRHSRDRLHQLMRAVVSAFRLASSTFHARALTA